MRLSKLLPLIVLAMILCGCSTPINEKTTSNTTTINEIELSQKTSKLFDSEIRSALKHVFGKVELVSAIEEKDFIHLNYIVFREVKEEDVKAIADYLNYKVEYIIPEMFEVMLSKEINETVYNIHIILFDKNVEVEIFT